MEDSSQCMVVVIGATKYGDKEMLAIVDGYRESERPWLEALNDLRRHELKIAPKLAVGDGALGFWKALLQVFGETQRQIKNEVGMDLPCQPLIVYLLDGFSFSLCE